MNWIKRFLVIGVLVICGYECYWPIPDYDRQKFDRYKNIPVDNVELKAELIYFGVNTLNKFKLYMQNRPALNAGERKIINKFKIWLLNNETEKD